MGGPGTVEVPRNRRAQETRKEGPTTILRPTTAFAIVGAFIALAFLAAVTLQTSAQAARAQTRPCGEAPVEDTTEAPACGQLRVVIAQLKETNRQLSEAQKEISRLRARLAGTTAPDPQPRPATPSPTKRGTAAPPQPRPTEPRSSSAGGDPPIAAPESSAGSVTTRPTAVPGPPIEPPFPAPSSTPNVPEPTLAPSEPTCAVKLGNICLQLGEVDR
jgi:hypothetical protein